MTRRSGARRRTAVRGQRRQTQARREGGIPPTKHRAADGERYQREQDTGERQRRRGRPGSRGIPRDRAELDQGDKRGHNRITAAKAGLAIIASQAERSECRAAAEHTEAGRGDLCRTATRRHTRVCRAVARTLKSPVLHRAHGCHDCDRMLTGHTLSRIPLSLIAKNPG